MKKHLRKLLLSSFFLALIISLIIIIFLPPVFHKYKAKIIDESPKNLIGEIIYFKDLNGDGIEEKIIAYKDPLNYLSFQIYDENGGIYNQWNFPGNYFKGGGVNELYFGDINKNGITEIFCFTVNSDSVFLNCYEPFSDSGITIRKKFITTIEHYNDKLDFASSGLHFQDMNNDGSVEIIFSIGACYSIQPRKIFIYNYFKDTLISSRSFGNTIGNLKFHDFNKDGFMEITGSNTACDNIPDTMNIPQKDQSAWLMLYDHNLNHVFSPVEFKGIGSTIMTSAITINDISYIILLFEYLGIGKKEPHVSLYDANGNLVTRRILPQKYRHNHYGLIVPNDKNDSKNIKVINWHGTMWEFDNDLNIISETALNIPINPWPNIIVDLNDNGFNEWIFVDRFSQKLVFTDTDFNTPLIYDLPERFDEIKLLTHKFKDRTYLFVQNSYNWYLLEYEENPLYYFKILLYIGIYLIILGFITLIRKIQNIQIRERELLKSKIYELQLKTINNQIEPHFTFNAFTAIASELNKSGSENIYNVFLKFTNLIRSTLISSDKISRTLEEEIRFIRNYLEIEMFRYKNKFEYIINIPEDIDLKIKVPKMILQVYVENAVKHGLFPLDKGGMLNISLQLVNTDILISIEDNGIGREKSKQLNTHTTGMGLNIMEEFIKLFNTFMKTKIRQEIIDLYYEASQPAGTRVNIYIPYK